MNIMKSKAGFTLVELIVVIAILGILAGVAIPLYSGYIKKANQSADDSILVSIDTAIAAAMAENGLDPANAATYLTPTISSSTLAITEKSGVTDADDILEDVETYYGKAISETMKFYSSTTHNVAITNGKVTFSEKGA